MMKFLKAVALGIAAFLVLQANMACNEAITDYDREKVRLDSLNTVLTATKVALNVNEAELQTRMGLISSWYIKLKDTTYDVQKKMQVDFNGFKVVYKRYIDNFFVYSAALDLHTQQYKKLEERVKKQELTRTEFKNEYETLKQEINRNYENAASIAKPVYDLEFSWNRYKTTMEAL